MQLSTIRIDKPDATNFILGQYPFHQVGRRHPRDPGRRRAGNQSLGSPSVRLPANAWCEAPALIPQ